MQRIVRGPCQRTGKREIRGKPAAAHMSRFVYAGFVFTGREEPESTKRMYIHAHTKLKKALDVNDELKAAALKNQHKRALFNAVSKYQMIPFRQAIYLRIGFGRLIGQN